MKEYLENSVLPGGKLGTVFSLVLSAYLVVNFFSIFLDGNLTWSIYAVAVLVLVFLPAAVNRDLEALPPFEVLLFLALPFTLKGIEFGFIASRTLNYLSAAGIALLVVTELDTQTSFRTTPGFSTVIVALTTIAVSGVWAVARWLSDIYLGTSMITSEYLLMWEFAAATLAGIVAGKTFSLYFSSKDRGPVR